MKYLTITACVLGSINLGLIIGILFVAKFHKNTDKGISPQQRIVGGKITSIKMTPYFAGMLIKRGIFNFPDAEEYALEDHYLCGCTIIGNYWIVTAAHCTQPFTEELFPLTHGYIRSGTDAWNHTRKTQKYMRDHWFKKVVQHEEYEDRQLLKDISLVKVKEPFTGEFSKRIPLAGKLYPYREGTKCMVTGFGATSSDGTPTEHLKSVTVQISNYTACKDSFDSLPNNEGIGLVNEWNFCAGSPKGGKDACKYDSGGPLVQNHVLIGIVSLGQDCALPKYPGVYTKVGLFTAWIAKVENQMKEGTGISFVKNNDTRRKLPKPSRRKIKLNITMNEAYNSSFTITFVRYCTRATLEVFTNDH